MSLIRWDPFGDMDTMFNRMTGGTRWPRLGLGSDDERRVHWSPSADISETDKEYTIRAEVPAVAKEDVQVTFEDGIITIKGERKQHREDKDEKYHRVESFYGSFERSFSLPDNVDSDAIRCESRDGILTVHIPKVETKKQQPKQIRIQ